MSLIGQKITVLGAGVAGLAVARALALRTGEPVIEVRRTLAFGGVPTILEELWLPGDRFKGLSVQME